MKENNKEWERHTYQEQLQAFYLFHKHHVNVEYLNRVNEIKYPFHVEANQNISDYEQFSRYVLLLFVVQ
jgi:hypothetical protein